MQVKLLRFLDLKERGIVDNRNTLKRWQEHAGFPLGRWLGSNTVVWDEEEVAAWLASRPTKQPEHYPKPNAGRKTAGRKSAAPRKRPGRRAAARASRPTNK